MKKLAILVGAIALTGSTFAQKPSDAPMSLEGQLGFDASTLTFDAPAIRFRYFVAENIAARLTVGLDNSKTTTTLYENADFSGGTGTAISSSSGWMLGIGGEYHFAGTDRLSPYGALEIQLGGGNDHNEGENTSNGTTYTSGDSFSDDLKTSMLGVKLAGGADYYFAENFYLGVELGLTFMSETDKEGEYSQTVGGTTTSGKWSGLEKSSTLSTLTSGSFRLGWRF